MTKGESKTMHERDSWQMKEERTEEADKTGPEGVEMKWGKITLESQSVTNHDAHKDYLCNRTADFCFWQEVALPTLLKIAR